MTAMVALQPCLPTSLYVGDLDPCVSEPQLLQVFSIGGPISSIRLCRDSATGQSLRYAYVNYSTTSDAYKAMYYLNHTKLNGKPIRIMWSQRDPFARKTGVGNLFVKNLDPAITSKVLQNMFLTFGAVLSCKVAEENGYSKGFGFVQFESEESASAAIKALHGTQICGKTIYVSKFVRKGERQSSCAEPKITNLYVKNLEQDLTEDVLRDKFSEFGKVHNVSIMKNDQGISKGFGFISFESPEDAQKAMDSMNGSELGSKKIFVGRAQKKAEREQLLTRQQTYKLKDSNVYVKNLDESIDDKMLEEHFNSFGQIISAKVMRHNDGKSKGFGFVCFSSPAEANKAIATLHKTTFQGKPIYLAIAQCKLQSLHSQIPLESMRARFSYPSGPTNTNSFPSVIHQHVIETPGFRASIPMISSKQGQQRLKNDFVPIVQTPYAPYLNHHFQSTNALKGMNTQKSKTCSSTCNLMEVDPAVLDIREKCLSTKKGRKLISVLQEPSSQVSVELITPTSIENSRVPKEANWEIVSPPYTEPSALIK